MAWGGATSRTGGNRWRERAPALPLLLALMAGLGWARVMPLPAEAALGGATVCLLGMVVSSQLETRVGCLLASMFCVGLLIQPAERAERSGVHISEFMASEARLMRLRGRIMDLPVSRRVERMSWSRERSPETRTTFRIDQLEILGEEAEAGLAVAGQLQVTVSGRMAGRVGDETRLVGWLSRSEGARNPGGFDLSAFDRRRGIDGRFWTTESAGVEVIPRNRWSVMGLSAETRRWVGERMAAVLSPEGASVGRAMLLGERAEISWELQEDYRVSGATHVLAISGMHVVILAGFLVWFGSVAGIGPMPRTVGGVVVIWGYAWLTGMEPPVVRAAAFLSIVALGVCLGRRTTLLNTLALTAVLMLLWEPELLVDLGAQLSFLAVLGMSWSGRLLRRGGLWREAVIEDSERTVASRWLRHVGWRAAQLEVAGIGIWLFTGPLIARTFGILVPVALPLNLFLVPLAYGVLWVGYVFLFCCFISPVIAWPAGVLFDQGLWLMNRMVEFAARMPGGHQIALPPAEWWLWVWYPLLLGSLLWLPWAGRSARVLIPILVWLLAAPVAEFVAGRSGEGVGELRMTMLDVGHGGAILLESPEGETLLFDCGSMHDGRHAARIVWECLIERGHRELDGVILSHADLDHVNNVPVLLGRGPVGRVYVSRAFLDDSQQVVLDAYEAAVDARVEVELLRAGETIRLGESVVLRVLNPSGWPPSEDDNANSLVVQVEYGGRKLLLTGDVEGEGQRRLFEREESRRVDVVMAPHHGGLLANPPEFAAWCRPTTVLVSCSDRVDYDRLRGTYVEARGVYWTSLDGAVTVRVSATGLMGIETAVPRGESGR